MSAKFCAEQELANAEEPVVLRLFSGSVVLDEAPSVFDRSDALSASTVLVGSEAVKTFSDSGALRASHSGANSSSARLIIDIRVPTSRLGYSRNKPLTVGHKASSGYFRLSRSAVCLMKREKVVFFP
jgi:hypothetical protein